MAFKETDPTDASKSNKPTIFFRLLGKIVSYEWCEWSTILSVNLELTWAK